MYSPAKLTALALIFAQLLGAIHCGAYDYTDIWVSFERSRAFPENAVLGGLDPNGYRHFVGRVSYANAILPARIKAETAYITFNNETVAFSTTACEVLTSNEKFSYNWVRSFDGFLERNAVSVGTNSVNDRVYVCRAKTDGGVFIGTLFLVQKVCIIRYEPFPLRKFDKYEVLVRKYNPAGLKPFDNQIALLNALMSFNEH